MIVDSIDAIKHEFPILPHRVVELLDVAREAAIAKDARTGKNEKSKPHTAGRKAAAKSARKSGAKRSGAKR